MPAAPPSTRGRISNSARSLPTQTMIELDGILLIDKPIGMTSHDVVNRVRRVAQTRRVGHAGTLDPLATGLLIMLVGKATKASQFLMSQSKEYTGTIHLGVETNTYDREGEVVAEHPVPPMDTAQVETWMKGFLGDQMQTPPMFSAIKVDGVPLYKMARKGEEVEREQRFIRISSFRLTRWESPELDFVLACSKGTYVRSVAHDLGGRIGCGAHLSALRRTRIGDIGLDRSVPLDAFMKLTPSEIAPLLVPVRDVVPPGVMMG